MFYLMMKKMKFYIKNLLSHTFLYFLLFHKGCQGYGNPTHVPGLRGSKLNLIPTNYLLHDFFGFLFIMTYMLLIVMGVGIIVVSYTSMPLIHPTSWLEPSIGLLLIDPNLMPSITLIQCLWRLFPVSNKFKKQPPIYNDFKNFTIYTLNKDIYGQFMKR